MLPPKLLKCLLAFSLAVPTVLAQSPVPIPEEAALQHLIHRVDPIYPDLAKAGRISGIVRLEATVTTTGLVADVGLIGGHPLLVQAAADAIVRWRFKPFFEAGQAVPVRVRFEVPFFPDAPNSMYDRELAVASQYYKSSEECQMAYKDKRYQDADRLCEAAVKLADQLPPQWNLERSEAHSRYGEVQLELGSAAEALTQFKKELSILEGFQVRDNTKLAFAHYHAALGLARTGDSKHALAEYREAEKLLIQPHDHIGSDFLKRKYAASLKQMYQSHAALLNQTGDANAASELERRAEALQ